MLAKYGVLLMGLLTLCYVAHLALEQKAIDDWPTTAGIIKKSKWTRGPNHLMMVTYSYTVDGVQYSSSTISPSYKNGNFFPANLENRLKQNQKVDVCYSAKDHSKSYLKRFVNYFALEWIGGIGAFATLVGVLVSLGILKSAPMKRRM